jgi:hypothetical protein
VVVITAVVVIVTMTVSTYVIPTATMITGMATLVMMTVTGLHNICVTKNKGASAPFHPQDEIRRKSYLNF